MVGGWNTIEAQELVPGDTVMFGEVLGDTYTVVSARLEENQGPGADRVMVTLRDTEVSPDRKTFRTEEHRCTLGRVFSIRP